ncbi:MarR family transcriptional regulator [Microvirga sp. W0021]|uniref:MarR family transcriptional regulator n=1 Tax=Hohaiivirga grylli TaxID=3133970 RepID=A0ABV0BH73_9HYPH
MNIEQKHKALLEALPLSEEADNIRLCFEVLSLASAIDRDCATRLSKYDLSEGRFIVLFLLQKSKNGLQPFEIAEQAGVTRATVTGLLDGLEKMSLITRTHAGHDRRMVTIHLTPEGWMLANRLFDEHTSWISNLLSSFDEEEKALLSQLLHRIWLKTDSGKTV